MSEDDEPLQRAFGHLQGIVEKGFEDLGRRLDEMKKEQGEQRDLLSSLTRMVVGHEYRIGNLEGEKNRQQQAQNERRRDRREDARGRRDRLPTWVLGIGGIVAALVGAGAVYLTSVPH